MLLSFLFWLSDGQEQISIPLGPDAWMTVSADPVRMTINKSVLPRHEDPTGDDHDLIEQLSGRTPIRRLPHDHAFA
jgi:hypothetical protein